MYYFIFLNRFDTVIFVKLKVSCKKGGTPDRSVVFFCRCSCAVVSLQGFPALFLASLLLKAYLQLLAFLLLLIIPLLLASPSFAGIPATDGVPSVLMFLHSLQLLASLLLFLAFMFILFLCWGGQTGVPEGDRLTGRQDKDEQVGGHHHVWTSPTSVFEILLNLHYIS
jgi:hypothetical protein